MSARATVFRLCRLPASPCPPPVREAQSAVSDAAFGTWQVASHQPARPFSTARVLARKPEKPQVSPKVLNLEEALKATNRPPPRLRMDSMRYMRHWTIHRAWLLLRRKQREQRERLLMKQYQSMHRACEELRNTAGPGLKDTGYLYRVAMEKKGVYGHDGIPIEYARAQTETPAREAWNHGWKR